MGAKTAISVEAYLHSSFPDLDREYRVDPHSKRMYTYEKGLLETATLKIPELGVEAGPDDIFDQNSTPEASS